MKLKSLTNAVLGIATEVIYAFLIMLTALLICLMVYLK